MYRLLKQIPDVSNPFIWDGGIIYTRGNNCLVRIDENDFSATAASGKDPFVLEGINGQDAIIRTKEHIMVLDKKNMVMLEYPLLHPTEISLVHDSTLFLTTTMEQQGRTVLGKYSITQAKFIWERDVFDKHTYYRDGHNLFSVNEAKNTLTCYNISDGSIVYFRNIYDLKAVIDKSAKFEIRDVVFIYECICLYLTSKDDQVLVGLDFETGAERWRVREGLYRSYNQATEETILSLELYDIIEIDGDGDIIHSIDLRKDKPERVCSYGCVRFEHGILHMAAEVYDKPGISVWNIKSGKYLGHHALYEYRDPDEPPVYIEPGEKSLQFYGNRMYILDNEHTLYVFEMDDGW